MHGNLRSNQRAVPDEVARRVHERLGVARVVLRLPPRGRDEVLPALDRFAAVQARSR